LTVKFNLFYRKGLEDGLFRKEPGRGERLKKIPMAAR
jgi:hypothetical protein